MLKNLVVLTSICLLSVTQTANSQTDKKTDLKYLETKVLYSQKNIEKDLWFDYKRALFLSAEENKPILISFCTDENSFCNKMYDKTFKDPIIKKYLEEHFISVKVDAQSNDRIQVNKSLLEKDLVKEYDIEGFPSVAFINSEGKIISGITKGFVDSDKFITILKYIASESYKKKTFKEFEKIQKTSQAGK